MGISSTRLQQLFFMACLACRITSGILTTYGTIIPQSPTVEIGKEFTATCVLYEAAHTTADNIYWTCNDQVPKEQYTKINDSAVSVTITITNETCKWLICHKKPSPSFFGQSTQIHGILLTKGYPPEKPENLSCMAVQSGKIISPILECTWRPGEREEGLPTNYTLFGHDCAKERNNSAQRNGGTLNFELFPHFCALKIRVEVENSLGKVHSDHLDVSDANCFVKTNPPSDVKIISENKFPRSLLISWKRPIEEHYLKLKYNIRFCPVDSGDWSEVPPNDTESGRLSFRLQGLQPYTEYVVQVRCIQIHGEGYWSDWSTNTTKWTPEDQPSGKPDLWRVVNPSQGKSERKVEVMCKHPVESNGRIRSYDIKIQKGEWVTVAVNGSEWDSSGPDRKIITLLQFDLRDETEGLIEVKARNSVGQSPQASLVIPKRTPELPSVKSLSWFIQDGKMWVDWKPPGVKARRVNEYILEWLLVSDGSDRALDWQREGRNSKRPAAIRGNLEKFKLYKISVYPIFSNMTGKPSTQAVYLEQGAPITGPTVKLSQNGKNKVVLEWTEIPLAQQRGFIINYTIFYKTAGQEHSIVVPPHTYSHTLTKLVSNSKYVVKVMASTVEGSTNSSDYTFNTLEHEFWEIAAIVVAVCLGFLFVVVFAVILCLFRMDRIKKMIWPPVPDPSNSTIAKWSPDFPSKAATPKESVVSRVEVDVFDGKSLSGEDKAGLPLRKDKYLSEEHSSGIGGSSCMSSPRQSVSDSDEGGDSGQTTASTVQYSSVVASGGYKGQTPCPPPQTPQAGSSQAPSFARSESTQPLLDGEEQLDSQEGSGQSLQRYPRNPYFRRSPSGNEDDGGNPGVRPQADGHGLALLRFSPLEEGSQQTTPTDEGQSPEGHPDPTPSYMPQRSGYRPQ